MRSFKLSILWTLCLFLSPVMILQGLWTRRRALKLPEAPGPRQGGESGPLLVVLGDSVVAGVGVSHTSEALPAQLAEQFTNCTTTKLRWRAIGTNGHRLRDVIEQLGQLDYLDEKPDWILVNVGVNDVSKLTALTRWHLDLTRLASQVSQRFAVPLVFIGLPPMGSFPLLPQPLRFALGLRAQMLDESLRKIASLLPNVYFVTAELPLRAEFMATDGYHPSAAGVARWCESLAQALQQEGIISSRA